jgi:hypothetical protein
MHCLFKELKLDLAALLWQTAFDLFARVADLVAFTLCPNC